MKIAVVRFPNQYGQSKKYEFKTDIELQVGDKVVCDTAMGYTVADVVEIKEDSSIAKKWIVSKIDLTAHLIRLEKEKKLAEIKAKLDRKRKEIEEMQILQLLAERDSEFAVLLEEYIELQKVS